MPSLCKERLSLMLEKWGNTKNTLLYCGKFTAGHYQMKLSCDRLVTLVRWVLKPCPLDKFSFVGLSHILWWVSSMLESQLQSCSGKMSVCHFRNL